MWILLRRGPKELDSFTLEVDEYRKYGMQVSQTVESD